jgi:hypothetical protein
MRRNYVALIGFVIGVVGTVLMYEFRPGPGAARSEPQFVAAAHDASIENIGDPI